MVSQPPWTSMARSLRMTNRSGARTARLADPRAFQNRRIHGSKLEQAGLVLLQAVVPACQVWQIRPGAREGASAASCLCGHHSLPSSAR
jgi:hypothetical protein